MSVIMAKRSTLLLLIAAQCVVHLHAQYFRQSCGADDFRCNNGRCIEGARRCDRVVDCPSQEDEQDCECRPDEFRCASDGFCIEGRKRCDGVNHCNDNSDELNCNGEHVCQSSGRFLCKNGSCISILLRCDGFRDCVKDGSDEIGCPCGPDFWQCDFGSCIKRSKRCDGRVDCPTDRSDERNCFASGYFRCRNGKMLPQSLRCNRQYDCDSGDYSDEKNCPCGVDDFKCDNGYCIPASKHCDRTHDCQDGSDERGCTYGTICMAYEYKCSSGQCVRADSWCNGTKECNDGSDERNCPCKRDEIECRDGSCINIALRCNGRKDCHPHGEDELNCGGPRCPPDAFTCDPSSSVPCARRCDGRRECDGGEDEDKCSECSHKCDGRCLEDRQICNGIVDCDDGSDELSCPECDGPNDFRCSNGECINIAHRCNGLNDCYDSSDEAQCNNTMPSRAECNENQFQCRDGTCIDAEFYCDRNYDCYDNSDEDNCPWIVKPPTSPPPPCHESEFTCYDGRCIPHILRCDNIYDCSDFSDEQKCYHSACRENEWQCTTGQCIPIQGHCDGQIDCYDQSDENDCFTTTWSPPITPQSPTRSPYTFAPPTENPAAYPPRDYSTLRPDVYPGPSARPPYPYPYPGGSESSIGSGGADGGQGRPNAPGSDGCAPNQWRCENGPCIDNRRRCDGRVDCPRDTSDELDCPSDRPDSAALNLKTYPKAQTVRNGGDVVFQCRDESRLRAPVRWVKEGGRPLKPGSIDRNGRLEMNQVTVSDSGTYICQAPRYLGSPGSEVRVNLIVENAPPVSQSQFHPCRASEATCGNGQCIPKSAVCDGKPDCDDRSDEDSCNLSGRCEPNEFRCANKKCVLKTWVCDSENDCGDGSDERDCQPTEYGQACSPVEFACAKGQQCIPRSYHCDGHFDCQDKSDEIGCAPVHVTRPPAPSNVRLNPGESLVLVCEAVGVPTPLISWRLNWGHVPPQCTSTSQNGVGTLTCNNMQSEDSGAYSCEAINRSGTTFAAPDAIVYVNKTDVCPTGYFNSEARSQSECIRCFCFGESNVCRSADLFTYNMPTPLGEGGTRLVGVKRTYAGDVQVDAQAIADRYYYQSMRNGATVTKLDLGSWYSSSDVQPYLTLPETYNSNQLTSYGGHIRYNLAPHSTRFSSDDTPDIIIKGKYQSLIYKYRGDISRDAYIEARLTPGNWMKPTARGPEMASREDIMMTLDNIEMILLRASINNAGVNITDFAMESAQHINVGLGAASLVEECTCPPGYEGLSCQKCAADYVRVKNGPWLGDCVPRRACPEGTYGDPNSGYDCKPCPCPLTNRGNQFARTCSVGASGDVICDCFPGYEGPDCRYCSSNYVGNPLIPGDSCKPKPSDNCNPMGTSTVRLPDECVCKDNVQGRYCNECKNGTFYLSEDFRHGCALCFCSGVTQQCTSSTNLRRKTMSVSFNVPNIVNEVKVYSSAPSSGGGAVKYNAPVETTLQPQLIRGEIRLTNVDTSKPSIFYWSLPASFAGDKVTAYGGNLSYTLNNVPRYGSKNNAADVQLISDVTFHYFGNFESNSDGSLSASVQLLEKGWQRPDGKEVSREHFLLALAHLKTILIKASYNSYDLASIATASIDTAEANGNGPQALHVEQCVCPTGFIGTSCENCAPGYTRGLKGLYLRTCEICDCNGHSNMCHPETGECYDCADNTAGVNCEYCKDGYSKDEYGNCVFESTTPVFCNCDPRGEEGPCDSSGYCRCKQNVEGTACDRCRPGTFGLDGANPLGCHSCYCSGATTDCHEATHYSRIAMAAPIFGENNGGYSLMDLYASEVINDQFVPVPNESQLMYVFSSRPDKELYWSLPVFPGNRVLSYGGTLSLTQRFETGGVPEQANAVIILAGEGRSVSWTSPSPLRSGEALSFQVPLREEGWYILNTPQPASREDLMHVLRDLKRVLVKATLSPNVITSAIADVSMDTATEIYSTGSPAAKGVEVCMCPEGYSGTSCETCLAGYYRDRSGLCRKCNCNGHDCQLSVYGEVVCNCRPPNTGPDCSTVGLVMELHPKIGESGGGSPLRPVTFVCRYRAPEPLTIEFRSEGREPPPPSRHSESRPLEGVWSGEHSWSTVWDTRRQGEVFECRTITERGFTLGVLTTTLPEKAGEPIVDETTLPPPPQSTISVRIAGPTIKIQEVGSTVNFTCEARSRFSPNVLPVNWTKEDGYLPLERTYIDSSTGGLFIMNLQISDSGKYICQTTDGMSTGQAIATLKVPGNEMTLPTVSIRPTVNDYYEGDRIELECQATGIPAPRITWQRASNRPLPRASRYDTYFVIDSAIEEDSGEYRCIATNAAGSTDRSAVVTVRARPSRPPRDRLTVSAGAVNVTEGQSARVVCTATASVPAGSIQWIRQDGVDLPANVRSDNGVLYIEYATPDDQGVYLCRTPITEIAPVPVVVTVLLISTPAPGELSNISVTVNQLKVPTGGSGSVDCSPLGNPLPMIRWIKYDGSFGAGVSQRDNSLLISNAQESDQGYYMCEGTVGGAPVANLYVYVEVEKREKPRVEIWPQGEQAVALGSRYELVCRILAGYPEPVVLWERGGGRSLSQHAQLQPNHVLSFETIEVNDEGEYTCSASNEAGADEASAVLKVRSPPVITITPSNFVQVVRGDPVTVECRANGYPEPMVSIQTSPEMRVVVPPARSYAALRIPSAGDRDDRDYVCTATSAAGTINEQFVVRVERGDGGFGDVEGSGDPGLNVDENYDYDNNRPSNSIAIEGRDATISCNASTEYQVQWRKVNGRPMGYNVVERGSELIIRNASKSDSGVYECVLVNRYTGEAQHATAINLAVVAPPTITLRPLTQTVQPGQSPTVECVVNGDDIQDILWRPVDRQPSSRVEIRGSTLIFHQIEVEDAGQYECLARNAIANASAVAEVIVSEESGGASTESHDNEQTARAGAAVHLSCNVTQPGLRIRWTKDGSALPKTTTQRIDGSLYIRLARKSDSGRYICIIYDQYGRQTSNYINLHIEGDECSRTQFRCYDDTGCVDEKLLCDGYSDCRDSSDEENCLLKDDRFPDMPTDSRTSAPGPRYEAQQLVSIEQPRRQYRVGENVKVACKRGSKNIRVTWERYGTNQYVDSIEYGDGSLMVVEGVEESDAGLYRCTGIDSYGRSYYDDFQLEVVPGSNNPPYPIEDQPQAYTARLRDFISLPCNHNLEQPVSIEWSKEYLQLPPNVRVNDPVLNLDSVSESDAGTYVCRVSNGRARVESRAVLRVTGVLPRFTGDSWLSMPTLKDAYMKFDIEVSFKPSDPNGLILYNGQNEDSSGDYLSLQLVNGVPTFAFDAGSGPLTVTGDRPLQLNEWHTVRVSRDDSKVTMDVDNKGPFSAESSSQWNVLDLVQPLYIGGVPDARQLPRDLYGASGFIGCVSMLILGNEEKNIMMNSLNRNNIMECDACVPNMCLNNGVCQEARNERGYVCLCPAGYAGLNCDRTGQACRPGLCGPGRCTDTADGYKCACPVAYTGRNCEQNQTIEYPAFTGSAYLAIKLPGTSSRYFQMSMKIKATPPVIDGIIMYCKARGGGFTALTVRNGKLEFRFDIADGNPVVLTSNKTLDANEWTDVKITRVGADVGMKINMVDVYEQKLASYKKEVYLETPMFVGGVDESVILNNSTGVTGGFSGCIKDVRLHGDQVDIVNSSIQSANVQECPNYIRGDIPEVDSVCSLCRNGGRCDAPDSSACRCPPGYAGTYCESRAPPPPPARRPSPADPCAARPCRNGGTCRTDRGTRMNYTCDCPLGYAGANCQMPLQLLQSVGFNGNGYLELPGSMMRYDQLDEEQAVIALAIYTSTDGVLFYQHETQAPPYSGDYLLIRVRDGTVVMEWNMGSGFSSISVDEALVNDGERHTVIAKLMSENQVYLSVDEVVKTAPSGFANIMNVDSNVYIGGMPERLNFQGYPGLNGCVEQVELMDSSRAIQLGDVAVAGRNTQRCRDAMFPDVYPFFEEVDVYKSPPKGYFNSNPKPTAVRLCIALAPSLVIFLNF